MSMAGEWADAQHVSLPAIVSSTDLFEGELFGDELIDIYNSSVAEGVAPADESGNVIPTLLIPPCSGDSKKKEHEDKNGDLHAGTMNDDPAVPIDDGLGAFRPSTSFNDLTTLLGPATDTGPATEAVDAAMEATILGNEEMNLKKRAATESPASPASKRKATASRGGRRAPVTKKQNITVGLAAAIAGTVQDSMAPTLADEEKSTPDPLPSDTVTKNAVAKEAENAKPDIPMSLTPEANDEEDMLSGDQPTSQENPNNTEADFKSIAQAAVSNLILNAGTGKVEATVSSITAASPATADAGSDKIDTSTAHIKALTGNNWVAACSVAAPGVTPVQPVVDSKSNNRARRQNLTPDERARQNRDRNREHARNTRLRKKAYVEELKRTLTELVSQRDATDFEKRQASQRELEQREVRFRVLEEFLKLRGRNEPNFARWAAILEDSFTFTLPITDFRKMVKYNPEQLFEQKLAGTSDAMADASHLAAFLQTLGDLDSETPVSFQYSCDRQLFFMDGCTAVMEWTATSIGAMNKGAASEFTLKGSIRGRFSPASNKLLSAGMSFDSGIVKAQLKHVISDNPVELNNEKSTDTNLNNSNLNSTNLNNTNLHEEVAAAQAAATQADAILDSLQMPQLPPPVPAAVNVVHPSSASESSSHKGGEVYSDESDTEGGTDKIDDCGKGATNIQKTCLVK